MLWHHVEPTAIAIAAGGNLPNGAYVLKDRREGRANETTPGRMALRNSARTVMREKETEGDRETQRRRLLFGARFPGLVMWERICICDGNGLDDKIPIFLRYGTGSKQSNGRKETDGRTRRHCTVHFGIIPTLLIYLAYISTQLWAAPYSCAFSFLPAVEMHAHMRERCCVVSLSCPVPAPLSLSTLLFFLECGGSAVKGRQEEARSARTPLISRRAGCYLGQVCGLLKIGTTRCSTGRLDGCTRYRSVRQPE